MRNNETGEFELIVGNRQLLSGFFIVVLLFAVAFAMGYVVGQNSPRSAKGAAETTAATTTPPTAGGRPQPAPNPPPPEPQEPAAAPAETTAPAAAAEAPKKEQPPPQPETKPAKEPERQASTSDIPMLTELPGPSGSFWQVVALDQPNAEVIAGALKKKGFNAFLSPGTKGLFRVMVGPYADTAAMGKAKTYLANAGFNSPIRK